MPKSSRFLSQLFASPGDSEALRRPRRTLLGLGSSTVPNSTKSGSEGFLSFKFLHGSNRAGALATVVSGTISSVRGRQKPRKIAELLLQARARAPGGGRFAVRVREKLEVGARQPEPCWDAFRTEALCWAWAWLPWFRKAEAWLTWLRSVPAARSFEVSGPTDSTDRALLSDFGPASHCEPRRSPQGKEKELAKFWEGTKLCLCEAYRQLALQYHPDKNPGQKLAGSRQLQFTLTH